MYTIELDAKIEPRPTDLDQGGAWSYFTTLRPRDWDSAPPDFTDKVVARVIAESLYHIIVKENDNHLHICSFLWKSKNRCNYASGWFDAQDSPCHFYDQTERDNLRLSRRKGKAIINIYSTDLITSYLSGEYASKIDKPFEILSANLPADLSELEFWMPAVGALKADRHYNPELRRQVALFKSDNPDLYATEKDRYPIKDVSFIQVQYWHNTKTHDFLLPSFAHARDHDNHICRLMHHINPIPVYSRKLYHNPVNPEQIPKSGHPAYEPSCSDMENLSACPH